MTQRPVLNPTCKFSSLDLRWRTSHQDERSLMCLNLRRILDLGSVDPDVSDSCGPNPERPGLVAIGTVIEPVPVTGFAANFSPMPRIASPPLGREMEGAEIWKLSLPPALPFEPPACCFCSLCWLIATGSR